MCEQTKIAERSSEKELKQCRIRSVHKRYHASLKGIKSAVAIKDTDLLPLQNHLTKTDE